MNQANGFGGRVVAGFDHVCSTGIRVGRQEGSCGYVSVRTRVSKLTGPIVKIRVWGVWRWRGRRRLIGGSRLKQVGARELMCEIAAAWRDGRVRRKKRTR
ncbi:hypothetical protein MA16_Dca015818 [Dendrobium catenatum]|uniref:Uncharacterized protein n=1 Tax=Dendrobium catenatum TaxID=906689 RepID=A0A2I0WSC4_9ASPA|nr:hypothetical protein MA16_Dca015818 [Dendrobium catenatum]